MTSAEEHQQQNGPQGSTEGGDEGRNRRRNRRGRGNRGRDPRREDGQQAPSNQEHSSPSPAPQAGGGSSESPAESPSPNSEERRRSRNRRRNRKERPEEGNEHTDGAPEKVQPVKEVPASPTEGSETPVPTQREARGSQRSQRPQRSQQPPQEKKERPPRGSVLNRRATRGEYDDAPKQKEETITYAPVVAATVESYVSQHRGWQKEVLASLRTIIKSAAPEIEEGIMWSQPVFSSNGPVCYIKAFSDTINFGFWRGTELTDDEGLFSGDLTKMRHITIRSAKDVKKDLFESMVRQAVKLNRDKGDPTLS